MKPALYYAIRLNLHNDIIAVTSERRDRYGAHKWNGRYVRDNTATHGGYRYGHSDIVGKFPTQEDAEDARRELKVVHDNYEKARNKLMDRVNQLYALERADIQEIMLRLSAE